MIGQMKSGGDGAQTRPRLLWLMNLRSQKVIYRDGSFFNELELLAKTLLTTYVYFLTSMNYVLKLLDDHFACPQHHNNACQRRVPPKLHCIQLGGWNEGLPLNFEKGICFIF